MNSNSHPLTITPHRGFFLLGSLVFVLSMAWWAIALATRPMLAMPSSWVHAWLAVFAMFGPFMGGFLFTAYSRWLGADPPSRACWMTSLTLSATGAVLFFAGAYAGQAWSLAGGLCWLAAWLLIFGHLVRAAVRGGGALLHAGSMMASVAFGLVALTLLEAWLIGGNSVLASEGLAVAFWGFLMGVYLVVAHRMIPFFAGRVLQPFVPVRPAWALLLALGLCWAHLALLLTGRPNFLWATDGTLAVLTCWLGWRWQWWRAGAHRLLAALFIAWFGLVLGLAVSAVQHGYLFATGEWLGLRLPEHLIGIGFFGGMVIAMGTRVTLGHSGRPLQMGPVAWWALLGIIGSAALRGLAEFAPMREELLMASALLWVAAGLAWVLRHAPMLILPRVDQRPG